MIMMIYYNINIPIEILSLTQYPFFWTLKVSHLLKCRFTSAMVEDRPWHASITEGTMGTTWLYVAVSTETWTWCHRSVRGMQAFNAHCHSRPSSQEAIHHHVPCADKTCPSILKAMYWHLSTFISTGYQPMEIILLVSQCNFLLRQNSVFCMKSQF